jgi:hypothetical protein
MCKLNRIALCDALVCIGTEEQSETAMIMRQVLLAR